MQTIRSDVALHSYNITIDLLISPKIGSGAVGIYLLNGEEGGKLKPARGRRPKHVEARTAAPTVRNRGTGLHVLSEDIHSLRSAPPDPFLPLYGPLACAS